MRKIHFIMLFIFFCSCISSTSAQNIAKGKKYTFSELPNYSLTEGNDDTDLTDGRKKSGKRFWQDKSTVGWNYLQKVSIDLDLGGVHSIDGFSINTARGQSAGVNFPLNGLVFTSLDNSQYEYHGDLMLSEDNSPGDYKVESFHLKDIKAKGRYVKLVLKTNGNYLFLDEIEIYGNKASDSRGANKQLIRKSNLDAFIKEAINESVEIREKKKYVESAKDYLGDLVSDNKVFSTQSGVVDAIKSVQAEVLPKGIIFTPINSTEGLNNFNLKDALANQKNTNKNYTVDQENGLHYFSLINNKSTPESISFQFTSGLRYIIYEILPVISQNRINIKDALKPVTNNAVSMERGENKYFVVKTFSQNSANGSLQVLGSEEKDLIGEISFNRPKLGKQHDALNVNLWAYLDKPVLKDNIEFAVNDMENAGVDVIVVHTAYLHAESLDDFSKLKEYLRNFKNLEDKKILLFYNFNKSPKKRFNGKTFLDRNWKVNFNKWYKALQIELSGMGVNTEEIYFYPYDEIKPKEVANFLEIIKWGKSSIPNFKTFVTINDQKSYEAARYADIVQVSKSQLSRIQKIDNNNIWVYTAANQSRDLDPYRDYRLMAWYAYYYDLQGVGFWNYSDLPSEDDSFYNRVVNGNKEYSVIYLDDNKNPMLSLRWLCFQQGLHDYKILKAYERAIGKDKVKGIVKSVIDNPNNSNRADEALKALIK